MDKVYLENYDTKERFVSYWHQLDEILRLAPARMLEVGVGNHFIADYLRKKNVSLVTLDIDPELTPDVVGSVLALPFRKAAFELVSCCEVLEHLPFEDFIAAIHELYRVSKQHVVISLPDATRHYRILITLPKLGTIKKLIQIPRTKPPAHRFDGWHYWEIGKAGYSLARIKAELKQAGFGLQRTYRIFENPYHRFFILAKD